MRPLVINEEVRQRAAEVKAFAEEHPVTMKDVAETIKGNRAPIGNDGSFGMEIPFGYRVVYSIEQQPVGLCHHISMSIDGMLDPMPNPIAFAEVCRLFGITDRLEDALVVWTEPLSHTTAVNALFRKA